MGIRGLFAFLRNLAYNENRRENAFSVLEVYE